ncbi:MAG: NUDIX hydrolase [Microbacterium sp.]
MTDGLPVAGTAVVLREATAGMQVLLLRRPDRGSFGGAWVFPGGVVEPADAGAGERERARSAALRETREEAGIRIRDLVALSCWEPPAQAPKRIRTWFFLAREDGDEVSINPGEIEDAAWMTVPEAFARHEAGTLELWPPTWVTLHGLLRHRTLAETMADVGEPPLFRTRVRTSDGGQQLLLPGDEEHPDAPGGTGARHRLVTGPRPWRYERS